MGPNNAVNMVWPEYQPYDELAQAQKLSGSSATGNVAAGTEGVYNQSAEYDSPPPQKSPSKFRFRSEYLIVSGYDSEPESEPEPQVQIADSESFANIRTDRGPFCSRRRVHGHGKTSVDQTGR